MEAQRKDLNTQPPIAGLPVVPGKFTVSQKAEESTPSILIASAGRLYASGSAESNQLRRETPLGIVRAVQLESAASESSHVYFFGVEPARRAPRRSPARRVAVGSWDPCQETGIFRARTNGLAAEAVPNEPEELNAFLVWLFKEAGLDAGAYRPKALQRRLSACLRALRVSSTEAARAALEQRPELLPRALEAMLIGVSGFFRDQPVFELLGRSLLPELLKGRRGLRVYSAGCSDGQELYSIAMLLEELGALNKSCLLGVDCRPDAIARARAGLFQAKELEGVPPPFRERCFELNGARACIAPGLRANAHWRAGNLLTIGKSGPGWDVILFRNVAIYLKPEQTAGLWERLSEQLRPGGVLVTGKAEWPPPGLPLRRIYPCVYQAFEK